MSNIPSDCALRSCYPTNMDMEATISPPHSLIILYLNILGYWPIETRSPNFNRLQLALGRMSFLAFILFVISLYVNIIIKKDLKIITASIPMALVYSMGFVKILFILRHRDGFMDLMKRAGAVEARVLAGRDGSLKRIVLNNRKMTSTMILSYTGVVLSLVAVFAIQPWVEYTILKEFEGNETTAQRTSIYDAWVPWDKTSDLNYSFTYVYDLIMLSFGSAQQTAYDTLILALMMHVIAQLRMMKYNLGNLTKDRQLASCKLVHLYREHQRVTEFIKTLDGLIKGTMFLYFCVASLTLCCTMYQVSLLDASPVVLVKMGGFALVLLMQLYMLFWFGNQVSVESGHLLAASYECEWYSSDLGFQKNFLLLRNCFLRQHEFNIGNFTKISLNTFLAILKTTYSVFTIMRQAHTTK